MFTYSHTRSKACLKIALLSCLMLLLLFFFTFLTGGYTNPQSTLYRYTHEYSSKYGAWLSSKLGVLNGGIEDLDTGAKDGKDGDEENPPRKFNIALTERAGHHDEVLGAFLYTLSTSSHVSNTTVYRNSYRYKFSDIVKPFYPYNPLPADAIFHALNKTFSFVNSSSTFDEDLGHDALILTSCDQTLPKILPSLLSSLSLLPQSHDFKILCIIHDGAHPPHDLAKIAGPLVERGLITFVVLSHSVARMVRESVFELAAGSDNELNGWDRVPVEVFVPIFPVPIEEIRGEKLDSGDTVYQHVKPKKRVLSNVIVQGNIDQHRRDYISLFRDLQEELERDPAFWGYQASSHGVYSALPSSSPPPFVLHLAGSLLPPTSPTQSPPIPSSLANVVKIHPSLSYPDFFSLMHEMDLVIPAFARTAYYKGSASSTVPASVIAEVPILATRRLLNAYQYLDARTSILRPAGMKEIEAVRLLRMGVLPDEYHHSNSTGAKGPSRRDLSVEEEDEAVITSDDEEAYMDPGIPDNMEERLGDHQGEDVTSPQFALERDALVSFSETTSSSETNDEITEPSISGTIDSEIQFDATAELNDEEEDQEAKCFDKVGDFNDGDFNNEYHQSSLDLDGLNPLPIDKVTQADTAHGRARGRSLLNAHSSSRSLRPGAGSLLPRHIPQGPVPPLQNPPQNTQDTHAVQSEDFKRRSSRDEESTTSEPKAKWDGDMNTLISSIQMRAMRREVYAMNERVLLRAFGG